ncbi:MAG: diguanylate cyclase/phosphodiesterase with [Pseudomonas sp.]|uniref:EAL domain-containing protein n=1 Tax=Pseudomonas entomophila TaxID=312306 RepID=UPI0015E3A483|nr:EAL domain-containing protein [Pseudomonas entomophila]MBA1194832.1 EAL domain-containing protein [Pseudomonas entomophila]MDF2490768.1 diguanylate cyclase/phosphodiesterase with [Pseudomonas sp.]
MPTSAHRFPRLPRILASDPEASEQAWQNAPQLLAALNGARLGAWLWDIPSGGVSWSRGTQALFGFDPGQPLPADIDYLDLLPAQDRDRARQAFEAVIAGQPFGQAMRHRIRWPDGSLHWLEISGSLMHDAEGRAQMIGVVREVTRQREREVALMQSEQRFATLFRLSPNVILLTRRHDGLILEANQSFELCLGWPLAEAIGKTTTELNLWVDPAHRQQILDATQHAGGPVTLEVSFRDRSCKVHDGILSTQGIEMDGVIHLLTTFVDLSEQVEREQRLSASEAKFASLFQVSPDPICVTRQDTGQFIEVNPAFTQTFGWHVDQVIGRTAEQLGLWAEAPERARRIEQVIRDQGLSNVAVVAHTAQGERLTCVIASRVIAVDGQACSVTTLRDITQQQRAEAALKASEEKFAKAFHSSPDAITITERDSGRYLEVNEGFCRLTGYRLEDVMGRSVFELSIWADEQQRTALLAELLEQGRVHRREMLGRHKRGDALTVEMSVEPITLNETDCLLVTARDVTQLKNAQAQIRHLAYHDPLTNLPNRALLMDRLSQQIEVLQRDGSRGALLFLDLDHFKHINDSLGHPVGDAVLKVVTARLEASVRAGDTVARLGGDEFVVLLGNLAGSREDVEALVGERASTLRQLLAEPMALNGQQLQVTPSIGVALIPDHGTTPADLLKRADIALYRAKDAGRNATELFHASMQTAASERLRMENDLRLAVTRNELALHFQPQVDARDQQIVGAEVLLRWYHPVLGQQSPAQFIHVLEESGLIVEVGGWILDQACQACADLLADGLIDPARFSLCVNISPRQFRQRDFVERTLHSLDRCGLPRRLLKLEITEGIVIQNLDDTIDKMRELKGHEVGFAMDDFGTGYSSLTYLKRLPVDTLKIDQSFVRDALLDTNDAEIVRAIVAMARSLRLTVIAEGVELPEQLAFLEQLNCHLYQGYLYSRPLPLEAFRALLTHGPVSP